MRAACLVGSRAFDIVDVPRRAPGAGEVEVEVAYAGICGTDIHAFHGAFHGDLELPAVLGHEMSGTVLGCGPGVTGWSEGERVAVSPLDWCGSCPACRAGHEHVCHRLRVMGYAFPGAMQERVVVKERSLLRLPPSLGLEAAALVEPVAVAVHDVDRSGLVHGERALVVGAGPIGLLVALVARDRGADVTLVEVAPERQRLAEALDLRVLDPAADDVGAAVAGWTDGAGVPVAFEVSGAAAGADTALRALAVRGRLVVVAIHGTPPPFDLYRVFQRELTVVGARVFSPDALAESVRLLAAGAIPAGALVSSVEPLEAVQDAFERLEQARGMKILLDCSA